MKTFWTIVLGLFLLVGCNNSSNTELGNWVKMSDFRGIPRGGAVSFVIGDKAYIGLGYNSDDDSNDGYIKDFWVYNSAKDSWSSIAPFPGLGRTNAVGFSINGKGYIGTGFDGINTVKLKDFWEYDPATNVWTKKDDFPGVARYKAVGFALKGYGYIGTGYGSDASDQNDFYKFDPTKASGSQWTDVQPIKGQKRHGATAFVYNDKAYVCTGSHNNTKVPEMYEYDPSADAWTQKIDLDDNSDWSIVRENASSFVLDNKAYVVFGSSSSSSLTTCWEYDFANNTWTEKPAFESSGREYSIGFTVGTKAFIATGQSGTYYMDDVWEFRPYEESDTDD
jgi:N-acetylneuraminic acid mutarotase